MLMEKCAMMDYGAPMDIAMGVDMDYGMEDELCADDDEMCLEGMKVERFQNAGATFQYIEQQYFFYNDYDSEWDYNNNRNWTPFYSDIFNHLITWFKTPNSNLPSILSNNFLWTYCNGTEYLFALSLLDLPFIKEKHVTETGTDSLKLTPKSNVLIFTKSLSERDCEQEDLEI